MNLFDLSLVCFGGGGSPPPVQQAAPPPATTDPAVEEAKRKERELARLRHNRASTILTNPSGLSDQANTKKATLLGG